MSRSYLSVDRHPFRLHIPNIVSSTVLGSNDCEDGGRHAENLKRLDWTARQGTYGCEYDDVVVSTQLPLGPQTHLDACGHKRQHQNSEGGHHALQGRHDGDRVDVVWLWPCGHVGQRRDRHDDGTRLRIRNGGLGRLSDAGEAELYHRSSKGQVELYFGPKSACIDSGDHKV